MILEFVTVDHWDEKVWQKWKTIYHEGFGSTGGKQERVFKNMFHKHMCHFHYFMNKEKIMAVAVTGMLKGSELLLIDYLAVSKQVHGQGVGKSFVNKIMEWGREGGFTGILIEVEAEPTVENQARIQFWKKCDFIETTYVHDYKVVPESYKAMYITYDQNTKLPDKEEDFFVLLSQFHQKSFRGVNQTS